MSKRRVGAGFDCVIVDEWDGMVVLRVSGDKASELFANEPGGHRWQRVPPNERHGKVHSSTVTVAVFPDVPPSEFKLRESDLEFSVCKGSGPGGQKRNKTDTDVQVKHVPTGMIVRCGSDRSQQQNRAEALAMLTARLAAKHNAAGKAREVASRKMQIGSGERSDKIRTIQCKNGIVQNNLTGAKADLERYLKGDIWCI